LCWSYELMCGVIRRSVFCRMKELRCEFMQPKMSSIDNGRTIVACAEQGTRKLSTRRSREEKSKRPPVTLARRVQPVYGHGASRRPGTISAFSSPDVRVDAAGDI
jgi:hypothetical protein